MKKRLLLGIFLFLCIFITMVDFGSALTWKVVSNMQGDEITNTYGEDDEGGALHDYSRFEYNFGLGDKGVNGYARGEYFMDNPLPQFKRLQTFEISCVDNNCTITRIDGSKGNFIGAQWVLDRSYDNTHHRVSNFAWNKILMDLPSKVGRRDSCVSTEEENELGEIVASEKICPYEMYDYTDHESSEYIEYKFPLDEDDDKFVAYGELAILGPTDCMDDPAGVTDAGAFGLIDEDFNCPVSGENPGSIIGICSLDGDRDGIPDYGNCGWCIHPVASEGFGWSTFEWDSLPVNGIDNNCRGACQANTSISCDAGTFLEGGPASNCSGLKNEWGVKDDFCIMAEDPYWLTSGSFYFRNVLAGSFYDVDNMVEEEVVVASEYIDSSAGAWAPSGTIPKVYKDSFYVYLYQPGGAVGGMARTTTYDPETGQSFSMGAGTGESLATSSGRAYCGKYLATRFYGPAVGDGSAKLVVLGDGNYTVSLDFGNKDVYTFDPSDSHKFTSGDHDKFYFTPIETCLAKNEGSAKTRETVGLPDSFIDSPWGELNYEKFREIMTKNRIMQNGRMISDWNWEYVPVWKDKCSDKEDNDGAENLYDAVPYSFYLPHIEEITTAEGNIVSLKNGLSFKIPLIDVDDPQCKFEDYENLYESGYLSPDGSHIEPKVISNADLRFNPINGYNYCLDEDEDGFCGCLTKMAGDSCSSDSDCRADGKWCGYKDDNGEGTCVECLKVVSQKSNSYLDDIVIECEIYGPEKVCDFLETVTNYSLSPMFPDCDDDPSDDERQYKYMAGLDDPVQSLFEVDHLVSSTVKTWEKTATTQGGEEGWPEGFIDHVYTAWHVHPFSPITAYTCHFNKWDFNCNKDFQDGVDYSVLFEPRFGTYTEYPDIGTFTKDKGVGASPFDFDVTTGIERTLKSFEFGRKSNIDMQCYHPDYALKGVIVGGGLLLATGTLAIVSPTAAFVLVASDVFISSFSLGSRLTRYTERGFLGEEGLLSGLSGEEALKGASIDLAMLALGFMGANGLEMTDDGIRFYKASSSASGVKKIASRPEVKLLDDVVAPGDDAIRVAKGASAGCFLENTSVLMADGTYKDIEEIQEGEEIIAYDLDHEEAVVAPITTTFVRNETEYLIITYEVIEE